MKFSDAIGATIIAVGIIMTAFIFFAVRHPASDVESVEVHEIPAPAPPHNHGI